MRTRDDLETAFRTLEAQMDDHLDQAAAEESDTAAHPPVAIELVHRQVSPRRRRRALVATATGLAVAAAAVVVGVGLMRARPSDSPSGGTGSAAIMPLTYLVFAIEPRAHARITATRTNLAQGDQEADLTTTTGKYRVHVGSNIFDGNTPHRVDVNGVVGSYGCQNSAICYVMWRYAPDSWAAVFPQGGKNSEAILLRIARALDFTRTIDIRSPVAVAHAPRGMQLAAVDSIYASDDGNGPDDRPIPRSWALVASYSADGTTAGRNRVVVNIGAGHVPAAYLRGTQRLTTGGRAEYWSAHDHALYVVDAKNPTWLTVFVPPAWTVEQARSFARGVTVVKHPYHIASWRKASVAFPEGS